MYVSYEDIGFPSKIIPFPVPFPFPFPFPIPVPFPDLSPRKLGNKA